MYRSTTALPEPQGLRVDGDRRHPCRPVPGVGERESARCHPASSPHRRRSHSRSPHPLPGVIGADAAAPQPGAPRPLAIPPHRSPDHPPAPAGGQRPVGTATPSHVSPKWGTRVIALTTASPSGPAPNAPHPGGEVSNEDVGAARSRAWVDIAAGTRVTRQPWCAGRLPISVVISRADDLGPSRRPAGRIAPVVRCATTRLIVVSTGWAGRATAAARRGACSAGSPSGYSREAVCDLLAGTGRDRPPFGEPPRQENRWTGSSIKSDASPTPKTGCPRPFASSNE